MASENRWVDEDWRRDWLFWLGAVAGVFVFSIRLAYGDGPWWWDVLGLLLGFGISVAVFGFVRTIARTYRAE